MKKLLSLLLALTMVLGMASIATAEEGQVINVMMGGGTPLSIDPALNSACR